MKGSCQRYCRSMDTPEPLDGSSGTASGAGSDSEALTVPQCSHATLERRSFRGKGAPHWWHFMDIARTRRTIAGPAAQPNLELGANGRSSDGGGVNPTRRRQGRPRADAGKQLSSSSGCRMILASDLSVDESCISRDLTTSQSIHV
jgi:hypothetical protein